MIWNVLTAVWCVAGAVFVIKLILRLAKDAKEAVTPSIGTFAVGPSTAQLALNLNQSSFLPGTLASALKASAMRQQMMQQMAPMQAAKYRAFLLAHGIPAGDPVSPVAAALQRIAAELRMFPDPELPNTLGYRAWVFDFDSGLLRSPHTGTPWEEGELHCETWDETDVVRGVAGIHAHLPPYDWKDVLQPAYAAASLPILGMNETRIIVPTVTGIVERFGRYVLGTEGWRAEWVIIRKLHARSRAVAAALKLTYPDVEITHEDR